MMEKIKNMLNLYPIVIILTGTPDEPYCGYSRTFIDMIRKLEIRYKSLDILKDDKLRGWLRIYHGWKTFPQLYINGKLIGGCDTLKGLIENGKIEALLPEECTKKVAIGELENIISKNKTVLFGEVRTLTLNIKLKQ